MKKYRVKIVTNGYGTKYYPQYRCFGWIDFKEICKGLWLKVVFYSLEEAEQFIAREKENDEKLKETVTYKYIED